MFLRVIVGVTGVVLILGTVLSAVRTVILPRSAQSVLNRVVFRSLRRAFELVAGLRKSFEWRDKVMAHFSPIALLVLVATWLVMALLGFMAIHWAVEQQGWADAFHKSGSSLLTLGFAPIDGSAMRAVSFIEAALGLALLALLITYLPTLYGAFSRRETRVAMLETRAGTPPSSVEMLLRFHRIGLTNHMVDTWSDWELWFAEVEESHTSYPSLVFLRSPQPERHWVTAAGTVLDGAALTLAAVDRPFQAEAAIVVRAGFISLRRIADLFGVAYDPDPAPTDPIAISRSEFDDALGRLADNGVPIKEDRDQAWSDFSGWRVNYDVVLLSLAEITMAPYAPWVSDRSTPAHLKPRVSRWGRRWRQRIGTE